MTLFEHLVFIVLEISSPSNFQLNELIHHHYYYYLSRASVTCTQESSEEAINLFSMNAIHSFFYKISIIIQTYSAWRIILYLLADFGYFWFDPCCDDFIVAISEAGISKFLRILPYFPMGIASPWVCERHVARMWSVQVPLPVNERLACAEHWCQYLWGYQSSFSLPSWEVGTSFLLLTLRKLDGRSLVT